MKYSIILTFCFFILVEINGQIYLPDTQASSNSENTILGGRLGIGTNNPSSDISISGSDPDILFLDDGNTIYSPIKFKILAAQGRGSLISEGGISLFIDSNNGNDNNHSFAIHKDWSSYHEWEGIAPSIFQIYENGNLNLYGETNFINLIPDNINGVTEIKLRSPELWLSSNATNSAGANLYFGNGFLHGGNGSQLKLVPKESETEIGSNSGRIKFWHSDVGYNNISCKNISLNGNLGIGVSSPNAQIHLSNESKLRIGPWEFSQEGGNSSTSYFRIDRWKDDGNSKGKMLAIDWSGKLYTKGVNVTVQSFPDYVFAENYDLMSLEELKKFINKNHHLPEIPTEKEVIENGLEVDQLTIKLLEKVEELSLHIIELNERIKELENQKQ